MCGFPEFESQCFLDFDLRWLLFAIPIFYISILPIYLIYVERYGNFNIADLYDFVRWFLFQKYRLSIQEITLRFLAPYLCTKKNRRLMISLLSPQLKYDFM